MSIPLALARLDSRSNSLEMPLLVKGLPSESRNAGVLAIPLNERIFRLYKGEE